jgi:hypothetical protein
MSRTYTDLELRLLSDDALDQLAIEAMEDGHAAYMEHDHEVAALCSADLHRYNAEINRRHPSFW